MEIRIRFLSFIKSQTGLTDVTVQLNSSATVNDLVKELEALYGERLTRYIRAKDRDKLIAMFVRDSTILKSNSALADGDELKIMPAVGGG